jgi:glycosyltransferase involved in cell wall biosynthesis
MRCRRAAVPETDRRRTVSTRGRIVIVSPWSRLWSVAPGAGVSDESHLLPALTDHGYEVHMLVPRAADGIRPAPGLAVHHFLDVLALPAWLPSPLRRPWLLPAFWTVAAAAAVRLARRLRPRLVLGFSHYGAYPAYRAARTAGAASVLKLFGVMDAMRLEWSLPRYLYHNLEAVLAFKVPVTHFVLLNDGTLGERVARRWGVAPERITWLPNGVDKDWAELDLDRDGVRRELGAGADTLVLLSLTRLVASKRIDRGIEAVAAAARATSVPLQLWVAGDGPLRGALERRAKSRGIDCRFLGGVPRPRVPHLLAAADALLATSSLTNMSIPTCEAMVVGTPVIGLDVAGTSEVVRHLENGLLVPETDGSALAAAVVWLAAEPELRRRLGSAARIFAAQNFMGWPERIAAEIAVLDRLARSGTAPAPHVPEPVA